ncbi:MAG: FAD-dependent monooxygenase [Gammaproteobacteria bacterium]|nr:FAD-dependent monooxygenase [Gammaproteobacteria bacterium]
MSYDLAVVGGGLVGMTCAALGARVGFSVALLEATAAAPGSDPDPRAYAITHASARIFSALGIWPEVAAASGPVETMRIEDVAGRGHIDFAAALVGEPALCHIVPHRVLHAALMARVATQSGVVWWRPETVTGLDATQDPAAPCRLRCASGRSLAARVVIGADGARSPLRALLGLVPQVKAYDQRALVATIRCARPHLGCARQWFLATGPLAVLPLAAPGDYALVWSLATAAAERLEALADVPFAAAIEQATASACGHIEAVTARRAYPLVSQHLTSYLGNGVAFIGDAAHVIHPLAGQGLNLGLLDAATLIEVLQQAPRGQLGARATLRRYERWRKGENRLMQLAMDGLHHLFTSTRMPLIAARGAGLDAVAALAPVQRLLIRRAMGLAGDLPAVARAGNG